MKTLPLATMDVGEGHPLLLHIMMMASSYA